MKATKITALIAAFMALAVIFTANFTSPKIMALEGETGDGQKIVITYDGNEGLTEDRESQYTDLDSFVDADTSFTKEGYTFAGWYNNKECDGEKVNTGDSFDHDVILYAKWDEVKAPENTESDTKDPTSDDLLDMTDTATDSTEDISTDSTDSTDTSTDSNVDTDSAVEGMIYATFFGNGGLTSDSDDSVKTGPFKPYTTADAKDGDSVPVIDNPFVREGYIFVSWNTKADGSGTAVAPGKSTMGKKDLSFYAIWEEAESTDSAEGVYVVYNGNGGKTTDGEEVYKDGPFKPCTDSKSKDGDSIKTAENPFVREGYVFDGWNTKADGTGTSLSVGKVFMIVKEYTLYAIWKEGTASDSDTKGEYQVTYLLDGTDEGEKFIGGHYNAGDKVTAIDFTGNVPEGKVFVYWVAVGDPTELPFKAGQEFDMPTGHVKFIPVFKEVSEITTSDSDTDSTIAPKPDDTSKDGYFVTYSANIGTDSEATFTDGPYDYRDVVVAKENTFSKDGYTFACWNTSADGTGTDVMINDKFYMPSKGVTLYAKWVVAGTTYTPNTSGGSAFSGSVKTGMDNTIVYVAYGVLAASVLVLIACSLKKKRED